MENNVGNQSFELSNVFNADDSYNFDICEMIDNFNFYDFIKNKKEDNNGAFLIITDNQYIIGYNSDYGKGSHKSSLARAYKEINGGGKIQSTEKEELIKNCSNDFITARITYDKEGSYILFNLTEGEKFISNKKISNSQLEVFKMFYEDYNEILKSIPIEINFHYELNGKSAGHTTNNLDEILLYLNKFVDNEKEEIIDKKIIGKRKIDNNKKLIKM